MIYVGGEVSCTERGEEEADITASLLEQRGQPGGEGGEEKGGGGEGAVPALEGQVPREQGEQEGGQAGGQGGGRKILVLWRHFDNWAAERIVA